MDKKLNFVFIFCDQLRHDFLGCYGADFIKTPNIDKIAQTGVVYDNAYSQTPVCVPARASLLTGRTSIKDGIGSNANWLRADLSECGIKTWPEILNDNGYYTAAIGKMHFYPWDKTHGFGYRVIAEDKRWIKIRDDYYKFLRENGERKYHANEHAGYPQNMGAIINRLPYEFSVDHYVGNEACKFLDVYSKDRHFALMVGFPGPHCPYDPCEENLARVDKGKIPIPIPSDKTAENIHIEQIRFNKFPWNGVDLSDFTIEQQMKVRQHYAASIVQIDDEVGEILKKINENDLEENTVVIFSSDHGDLQGDHGLIGKGPYYEGSSHIPMIVHTPEMKNSKRCNKLVGLSDITATLLAFSGQAQPAYYDCTPLPELGFKCEEHDILFGLMDKIWFATDGRYKMSKFHNGDIHFFDLKTDPKELCNLYSKTKHEKKYKELDNALTAYVMSSIIESNFDKRVDSDNNLYNSDEFAQQDRIRKYPIYY